MLNELVKHLAFARYFDVITGYFQISGFNHLAAALKGPDKVRILVGLEADDASIIAAAAATNTTLEQIIVSDYQARQLYQKGLSKDVQDSEDSPQVEEGILAFIEALKTDCADPDADKAAGGNGRKLELRLYPKGGLHAKVYILRDRFSSELGKVITGSSNVTANGLKHNLEFNVLLKDNDDVDYALYRFEELWKDGIDLQQAVVETIQNETWLRDNITPYQLYLKMLLEYFREELDSDKEEDEFIFGEGFKRLNYQIDAARDALKKLELHNGVFLSDVVGLGKTFVTALVLQKLKGRKAIICPPVLTSNWKEALDVFEVTKFDIYSLGKLKDVNTRDLRYVIIDEAHRFRNTNTAMYEELAKICRGRKVILVSATPINNRISDIEHQLQLFQPTRNSTIPGAANYETLFQGWHKRIQQAADEVRDARVKGRPDELAHAQQKERAELDRVAGYIQDKILKHLMVRRTRKDIEKYYSTDIKQQGIKFPKVETPERLVYEYKGRVEDVFLATVELLKSYRYARYTPLLYLKDEYKSDDPNERNFGEAAERNIGGFMKGLLVKRLESSFYAFTASINRFIGSAEYFLRMFADGTVYLGDQRKITELIDNEDWDGLDDLLAKEKASKYPATAFRDEYVELLKRDLAILIELRGLWASLKGEDPKLARFKQALKETPHLMGRQVVVFTESAETGKYLYDQLYPEYKEGVMLYFGNKCYHDNKELKTNIARGKIANNFDPRAEESNRENELRVLIATDVLAEGVNLHRSNQLINYDLPWNPTRVLQRVGRINRIGSPHGQIYIYNFFPTTHAEAYLSQEANIQRKLTLFHGILGEDAKYLSDSEQISSKELFDKLNNSKTYEGEDGQETELEFLKEIRSIRDNSPELFKLIDDLPLKIRCCYPTQDKNYEGLVTFFRKGLYKKFYWSKNALDAAFELTFFEAVRAIKAPPEMPAITVKDVFYSLLANNKLAFEKSLLPAEEAIAEQKSKTTGGSKTPLRVQTQLTKFRQHHESVLVKDDERYLLWAVEKIVDGALTNKMITQLKTELEKPDNFNSHQKGMKVIRKIIGERVEEQQTDTAQPEKPKEIVLSGLLL